MFVLVMSAPNSRRVLTAGNCFYFSYEVKNGRKKKGGKERMWGGNTF